jgi:hypothetical protein
MKFFGVSSNPGALRGLGTRSDPNIAKSEPGGLGAHGQEIWNGSLWLVAIGDPAAKKLTSESDYSSPIFSTQGKDILALKNAHVVRISIADGKAQEICSIASISKLVGFSREDPASVLVLGKKLEGNFSVGLLSVPICKVTPVAYDLSSGDDRRLLEHLEGWDRDYGDMNVYVMEETKRSLAGNAQWTDVFVKSGDANPVNVSKCDGVYCGQPSLSADGNLLVFVKAEVQ